MIINKTALNDLCRHIANYIFIVPLELGIKNKRNKMRTTLHLTFLSIFIVVMVHRGEKLYKLQSPGCPRLPTSDSFNSFSVKSLSVQNISRTRKTSEKVIYEGLILLY